MDTDNSVAVEGEGVSGGGKVDGGQMVMKK